MIATESVTTGYAVIRRRNAPPRRHVMAPPLLRSTLTRSAALCGADLSNWDRREQQLDDFLAEPTACAACRRELRRRVEVVEPAALVEGDRIRLNGKIVAVGRVVERDSFFGDRRRTSVYRAADGKLEATFHGGDRVERVL